MTRLIDHTNRRGPVGVFFANGIGYHIMALPALRALADAFPRRVVLFAMPGLRELVLADVAVQETVPIDLYKENGRNKFDPEVSLPLPRPLDLFVSLNPWHSSDVDRLLELVRPAHTVGMFER